MASRRVLNVVAFAIVFAGGASLATPKVVTASPRRMCELKCPTQPGWVFCGGWCNENENHCYYGETAAACDQI
jgi:hypothetical protein